MSRTTDILICVSVLDEDRVDEFNAALELAGFKKDGNTQLFVSVHEALDKLPGCKRYTDGLFAACWNFGYPENHLIPVFKDFPWEFPEKAILIISEECGATEVIRP